MSDPIIALAQAVEHKQVAVLATVVEVVGASPAKAGAQIVQLTDGATVGTVGGGRLEAAILADARAALAEGCPRLTHYRLAEDGADAIGVLCGGEVRVFVQPYQPPARLVIVGGGHIGRPLRVMGEAAGFEVSIVDVEGGRATAPDLEGVALTLDTYVVIITTDHIADEAVLRQVLPSPVRYIGMIGSRTKCQTILGRLLADGYSDDCCSRIYAPIGLELGAVTPGEIAVAILAEVVAVRHGAAPLGPHVRSRRVTHAG